MASDNNRKCISYDCPIRTSCARYNDDDFGPEGAEFLKGSPLDAEDCGYFVVRRALGRGEPDLVFREHRKRGRVHNPHAGVRRSYPGSEALFGAIFGKGKRDARAQARNRKSLPNNPKRPDLMVKRHIRDGKDINNKED